jgi:glyoxylase-like metal-dependent hydrolase (beta-lactamase superfamily II)
MTPPPTSQPTPGPRAVSITLLRGGALRLRPSYLCAAASSEVATLPMSFALIQHPTEGPILFDTGTGDRALRRLTRWALRCVLLRLDPALDALTPQLAALGVGPDDVRHVILSHLHYDHTGGLPLLTRARVHVARAEWAARPQGATLPALLGGCYPADYRDLPTDRLHLIDHDAPFDRCPPWTHGHDLFGDGSLWLLPTPGHTAGHQSLWARLEGGGESLLLGDAVYMRACYEGPHQVRALIRRVFADPTAAWDTTQRLHAIHRARPDLQMIPCHDPDLGAALHGGPLTLA